MSPSGSSTSTKSPWSREAGRICSRPEIFFRKLHPGGIQVAAWLRTPSMDGPNPLESDAGGAATHSKVAGLKKGISRRVFLHRGTLVAGVAAAVTTVPGL